MQAASTISNLVPLQAPGILNAPLVAPAPAIGKIMLWQLIVAQLDISQKGFSTREIAELLGLQAQSVAVWCRKLFPRLDDEPRRVYWLEFEQAVLLICKICKEGRRLPQVGVLYAELLGSGIITTNFPRDNAAVVAANRVLARRRQAQLQRLQ